MSKNKNREPAIIEEGLTMPRMQKLPTVDPGGKGRPIPTMVPLKPAPAQPSDGGETGGGKDSK